MSEETKEVKAKEGGAVMAILCYLGILIIIPLVSDAKKDAFVLYHIKQGLVLLIAEVGIIFLAMIPVLGWVTAPILGIILFVLFIIGIINAATSKKNPLPIIGKYAEKIKI